MSCEYQFPRDFIKRILDEVLIGLAAELSYTFLLSVFPFILLLCPRERGFGLLVGASVGGTSVQAGDAGCPGVCHRRGGGHGAVRLVCLPLWILQPRALKHRGHDRPDGAGVLERVLLLAQASLRALIEERTGAGRPIARNKAGWEQPPPELRAA